MGPTGPGGVTPTGQALDAVKLPAIFLIITGALGIVVALGQIAYGATGADEARMQQALNDPNTPEWARSLIEMSGSFGITGNIIGILVSAFIIFGALKMLRLQSFGLSMAASIVAMIPCYSCCCIGLPIGIWALVVINKPEVKAAFATTPRTT